MLSKNKISFINSLNQKKYRTEYGVFVAEGTKLVTELLDSSFELETLVALPAWYEANPLNRFRGERIEASEQEMKKITLFSTPSEVLAVVRIPQPAAFEFPLDDLVLALDTVQNPGNLGTIIRLADWFGIKQVVCSLQCADIYNPKTVQSTMGAISRVTVSYHPLEALLERAVDELKLPVYGAFLEGQNIYRAGLSRNGVIVMGNEGNGISSSVERFCTEKLNIPNFPIGSPTSESLNVAIAASIVCSEFRRRHI